MKRPCFNYEIGLCPGTCIGAITHEDYVKNIERLKCSLREEGAHHSFARKRYEGGREEAGV